MKRADDNSVAAIVPKGAWAIWKTRNGAIFNAGALEQWMLHHDAVNAGVCLQKDLNGSVKERAIPKKGK
ncbi:hypothetical protein QJS10_CPA01g02760 [Acorus calamus]|uniref:Uncharacterized protein n=1 Tax=Acorus calamus TaxID=4465 RepID=A0AAV9FKI6_ACOCL|nr:hypothetical protein QJS10_CPA01g02760 [Acorus calamus]